MTIAIDTNVLAYAEGTNGAVMKKRALELIERLPAAAVVIPAQVLGELFNVLVRKAGRPAAGAREAVLTWQDAHDVAPTSSAVMARAADLAADHRLGIWDAVILAAAAEAGCRLLLSEDLHDGFTWSGLTVVNPFAAELHPLLKAWLG